MPVSDAQKRATKKWNNANMQTLSVKVKRDYADQIRAKAAEKGTTPAAIIRKALDEFMDSE
jgi:hypothetical protein